MTIFRKPLGPSTHTVRPMKVFVPPAGGDVKLLDAMVYPSREWQEAINAAAPETALEQDMRKVGSIFLQELKEPGRKEILLVNFGKKATDTMAADWGENNGLRTVKPRELFAIGEHHPTLNADWKLHTLFIGSQEYRALHEFSVSPYLIYWGNSRFACLGKFGVPCVKDCWFAFVSP